MLEEKTFEIGNIREPFILDLPPFEWELLELVVLEFLKQSPVHNLQEMPLNYSEPTILIGDKEMSKEEVTAVTRFEIVVTDSEIYIQSTAKEDVPSTKMQVTERKALDFLKLLKRNEYKIIK